MTNHSVSSILKLGILYFISKPFEKNSKKRFTFLKVWREISLSLVINTPVWFLAHFALLLLCKKFSQGLLFSAKNKVWREVWRELTSSFEVGARQKVFLD